MSCCDDIKLVKGLLPLAQASQQMLDALSPLDDVVAVPLTASVGCILADDILSPIDVPPFNNSAMDGYAMSLSSLTHSDTLTMVGKSFAGAPFTGDVGPGQCIRIMTGAKLHHQCDTVVMQEKACANGNQITFDSGAKLAQNVRKRGEEFRVEQLVLTKGTRITPRHIALLASLGFANLAVIRKVKVAIFSTGDELVALGKTLADGQIYDSNRFALIAMLENLGVDIIDYGVISDDPELIRAAFVEADKEADVIISSGGVSVGEADYTRDIIQQLGQINFWKLAIKPGKPVAFGHFNDSVFFGLPGNPVSAMVTFYHLAKPALLKLGGGEVTPALRIKAQLTHDLRKSVGRLDFQRGIVSTNADGQLEVCSTGMQSSSMMGSMCLANCFIVLAQEQGNVTAGDEVTIELFDTALN